MEASWPQHPMQQRQSAAAATYSSLRTNPTSHQQQHVAIVAPSSSFTAAETPAGISPASERTAVAAAGPSAAAAECPETIVGAFSAIALFPVLQGSSPLPEQQQQSDGRQQQQQQGPGSGEVQQQQVQQPAFGVRCLRPFLSTTGTETAAKAVPAPQQQQQQAQSSGVEPLIFGAAATAGQPQETAAAQQPQVVLHPAQQQQQGRDAFGPAEQQQGSFSAAYTSAGCPAAALLFAAQPGTSPLSPAALTSSSSAPSSTLTSWSSSAFPSSFSPPFPRSAGAVASPHSPLPYQHRSVKAAARKSPSLMEQHARHAALLRLRRADRDKAVAARRRQFLPVGTPPPPQPLLPLLQELQQQLPLPSLLLLVQSGRPLQQQEQEQQQHLRALRLFELLHEQLSSYASLLLPPAVTEEPGDFYSSSSSSIYCSSSSSSCGSCSSGGLWTAAPQFTNYPGLAQDFSKPPYSLLVGLTAAVLSELLRTLSPSSPAADGAPAAAGGEDAAARADAPAAAAAAAQTGTVQRAGGGKAVLSPAGRATALLLLQQVCGCIAAAAAAQAVPEDALHAWLPLLLQLRMHVLPACYATLREVSAAPLPPHEGGAGPLVPPLPFSSSSSGTGECGPAGGAAGRDSTASIESRGQGGGEATSERDNAAGACGVSHQEERRQEVHLLQPHETLTLLEQIEQHTVTALANMAADFPEAVLAAGGAAAALQTMQQALLELRSSFCSGAAALSEGTAAGAAPVLPADAAGERARAGEDGGEGAGGAGRAGAAEDAFPSSAAPGGGGVPLQQGGATGGGSYSVSAAGVAAAAAALPVAAAIVPVPAYVGRSAGRAAAAAAPTRRLRVGVWLLENLLQPPLPSSCVCLLLAVMLQSSTAAAAAPAAEHSSSSNAVDDTGGLPLFLPFLPSVSPPGRAAPAAVEGPAAEKEAAAACAAALTAANARAGGLAVLRALLQLELEQQHAVRECSAADDRRAVVAESLWCLLLFLEPVFSGQVLVSQRQQQQQQQDEQHTRTATEERPAGGGGSAASAAESEKEIASSRCSSSSSASAEIEATAAALERDVPDLALLLLRLVAEAAEGAALFGQRGEQQAAATAAAADGTAELLGSSSATRNSAAAQQQATLQEPSLIASGLGAAATLVPPEAAAPSAAATAGFLAAGQPRGGEEDRGGQLRAASAPAAPATPAAAAALSPEMQRLQRFNRSGADVMLPALKLLALLCSNSRLRRSWADLLVERGGSDFLRLLFSILKRSTVAHRGVVCASLSLVASLAAGLPQHMDYVSPLLPAVAEVLSSTEPFDIKREAAVCLLHMALNDKKRLLPAVVEAQPSVLQGMLDLLEQYKHDRTSVVTALDFLAEVLQSFPMGRLEVYRRDGIAKIEAAQFLHDAAVDEMISWMVSTFFDDILEAEGAGEEEETCERIAAEEQQIAQQFIK